MGKRKVKFIPFGSITGNYPQNSTFMEKEIEQLADEQRIPAGGVFAGKLTINGSHGDAELVLGWWGWYGGTAHVAKVLEKTAEKAIADPEGSKYSFEYDAATWEFYNKFYPTVIEKIKEAVALGAWEVTGGTYAEHLPYQVSLESNIRQWVLGTRTIREILGFNVKTFHFQEFMLFPQMPMILTNVGMDQAFYENHMAICGRLHKDFIGVRWWEANDGSRVKASCDFPELFVDWPDLLHLVPTRTTLDTYIRDVEPDPTEIVNPSESDFFFDAADFTDSYGNLASIYNCHAEIAILTAERTASVSTLMGGQSHGDQLTAAWRALLGSQTHGIMYCGSEVYCNEVGSSTYEGGKYLRTTGGKLARDVLEQSLAYIASQADTRTDKPGKALVVFNPLGHKNTNMVEKPLTFAEKEAEDLKLWCKDQELPVQLLEAQRYADGSLKRCRLLFKAEDLHGMGYRAYGLEFCSSPESHGMSTGIVVDRELRTVENQFVKLQFHENGAPGAIYSKKQDSLILGSDTTFESEARYDRTCAIRFRSTRGRTGTFYAKGWEIVEENPLRVVVRANFESNMAYGKLYLTLYDNMERVDIRAELSSKSPDGDILEMAGGERQERLWVDFIPAFKGKAKCDTVADVLREQRSYYFSNTWIHFSGQNTGFTLMHKGIHAWDVGYSSQVPRDKSEMTLAAQLGQTVNCWVPGMLRVNMSFADDGVLREEFALLPVAGDDEYQIAKAVQNFYFDIPSLMTECHEGEMPAQGLINIKSDNALVSAFYADESTGGIPAVRLWNPSENEVDVEVEMDFAAEAQGIRFDGQATGEVQDLNKPVPMPRSGLKTFLLNPPEGVRKAKTETGMISSTLPFLRQNDTIYFDAPLEGYRLYTQYAKYRTAENTVYFYTDPYDEIEFAFHEEAKEGDYRIWNGRVEVPQQYQGCRIRLVIFWRTSKRYGYGTCILTDDYAQRADEPVTVFVNGEQVKRCDFDLSDHLVVGSVNKIRLKVLATEIPEEAFAERPSVAEFDIRTWAGPFEEIGSAKLRIGWKLTPATCKALSECALINPDFETSNLTGWKVEGDVEIVDDFFTCQVLVKNSGCIEQNMCIQPGNYLLRVSIKTDGEGACIGVQTSEGAPISSKMVRNRVWETHSAPFSVAKGMETVRLFIGAEKGGTIRVDNVAVVSNKRAAEFPGALNTD